MARVSCILRLCRASEFPRCCIDAVVLGHVAPPLAPSKTHTHSSCYTGAPEEGGCPVKKHPCSPEGTKTRRGGSKTEIQLGGVQAHR